ncbi:calcium uptake protein 3, mitochondrial isoform X2 [Phlebotomus argentipes]|uniref:calcium uptake protein 3, mitochondrial isoform X2 n=1 Tax=Phlebotomus argentipes TaxID=94469 RepID=UPI002892F2FB|nr:calcium uptake protein 3, mitochondrial isoform X2 [Phlebotomus argentipes]
MWRKCFTGGTVVVASLTLWKTNVVLAETRRMKQENSVKLTSRERRFINFASVEIDGQLYMTPQDFLDSVVEQEPRPRLKRKSLAMAEIGFVKDVTPALHKGSSQLFRNLRDKGIVSYTEYLFLLSILTKPHSAFRIAFNMFDTDGNQRVDKHEFLVMERIFSYAWREKRGIGSDKEQTDYLMDNDEGLQRRHKIDTTLQVHFFGSKGNKDLHYEGFYKFMDDLQTEVLELEFNEFSKGKPAISEIDFATILLRYTYLDVDDHDKYLDRLLDRVEEKGITFKEFRNFCQFLNNLEDFSIAMRMYTLADRAISKDEFSRAVKICTGFTLTPHIIKTVFALFDEDGDGLLSYKEFIAIMKDRLHRGCKSNQRVEGWDAFKACLKNEIRQNRL